MHSYLSDEESIGVAAENVLPIMVVDLQQLTIIVATPTLERLFGYEVEGELSGNHINLLIPSERHAAHAVHTVAYSGNPKARAMGANLKLEGKHRDGSTFPVEIGLYPKVFRGKRSVMVVVLTMASRV